MRVPGRLPVPVPGSGPGPGRLPTGGTARVGVSRRAFLGSATATVALATACGGSSARVRPVTVGRYASANPGSVNTYWVQGRTGLIVVDAQRTLSDARRVVAEIALTRQPVAGILLTHSHPDHVSGAGVLRAAFPNAPLYASEATAAVMRADPLGFYPLTRRQLGADYPATMTYPNRTFGAAATLDIGGTRIETAEFGPGESETATAYHVAGTGLLFTGDLVCNRATPALLEGHSCGWLTNLGRLSGMFPTAHSIYPGHGAPGARSALAPQQLTYLRRFRGLVGAATAAGSPSGRTVTATEQAAIIATMNRFYPGYPSVASLPNMPQLNVAAVAKELLVEGAGTASTSCCCGT